MILVKLLTIGYRATVRLALAFFVTMAVFLSGIHSGPAEAHENDPEHTTTHHVEQQDDGSKQPTDVDQHGCHHHCPSAAAPFAGLLASADFLTGTRFQPAKMVPLTSTTRAPPLDPPKA